jgi:hypothetical protein
VAAILAQMRRDAVGARGDGLDGGPHRVGMGAAACIAQRRHMVDIDAETKMRNFSQVVALKHLS